MNGILILIAFEVLVMIVIILMCSGSLMKIFDLLKFWYDETYGKEYFDE